MKKTLVTLLTATCVAACLAPKAEAQSPAKSVLDEIVAQLETDAAAWLEGKDVGPAADHRLRALTVDAAGADVLSAALLTARNDPVSLYVGNKLLQPVLMARSEVVAKILPSARQFRARAEGYQDMPHHNDAELRQYQTPAGRQPTSQQADAVRKLQEQKLARERSVALHNQQLHLLEINLAKLMLYAATDEADRDFLEAVRQAEEKGRWSYADMIQALRAEADRMSEARAKSFYEGLVKIALPLKDKKRSYARYDQIKIEPAANSVVPHQEDFPAVRMLQAVNVLATRARMPAHNIPRAPGDAPNRPPPRRPRPRGGAPGS